MENDKILEIKDLFVKFPMDGGAINAVNGVNLSLGKGETLGVVGESGCGKSVTMSTILRLVKTPPARIEGEIYYKGQNILDMQIAESLMLHEKLLKNAAMAKALELLKQVEIPNAEKRINDYPHQLSGGMRQRVMIAMALACKPQILLADEPTTALDVTIQAQIIDLIKKLRGEYGMSIMIVTHDLGVISDVADRVVVFYSGQIVEEARTAALFKHPKHPYTKGLLACIPTLQTKAQRLQVIEGNIADPANRPSGCPFHPRCRYATERCRKENPKLYPCGDGHMAACHLMEDNG